MTKISFMEFAQLPKEEQEKQLNELQNENTMYRNWWMNESKKVEALEAEKQLISAAAEATEKETRNALKATNQLVYELICVRSMEEIESIKTRIIGELLFGKVESEPETEEPETKA